MDDSDSTSIGLIVLIQLVFAGLLIMGLFSFVSSIFSDERFQETVYAVDNALLADALQVQNTGTMRVAYFFNQAYKIHLEDPFVRLSVPTNSPISRRFASREDITVTDGEYETRLISWVRGPGTLSARTLSIAETCPHSDTITQVSSAVYMDTAGMSTIIYDALLRGFLSNGLQGANLRSVTTESVSTGDIAIFTRIHPQDNFVLQHGRGEIAERTGCLIQQELSLANYAVSLELDVSLYENAVRINIPEDVDIAQERQILDTALSQAFRSVIR